MSASTVTQAPARSDAPGQVGASVPRSDARAKLRGSAQYVGDINVPGMLHGQVLRSVHAHARINAIDVRAAKSMPGVVAVLTGDDLMDMDPYYGHAIKDRPILAIDRVRFAGEPVAAVAARDEATAFAAVQAIDVEYEPLDVVTFDTAERDSATPVHEGPVRTGLFHGLGALPAREGNVCYRYGIERGDAAAVSGEASVVVEGEYEFPAVYQYALETHSVIARYDEDGAVEIWATCQHPFLVRAEVAELFGLPPGQVRIHVPYLGGGFGSKSYTKMEPLTVALARKARKPVRIVNRVDESMATTRRHNMRCWMRTAATDDGVLLSREVRLSLDTGAYADNGPRVTATAGDAAPGPYRWQALSVDAACVYTNTSPAGSYRAFGATHLQWVGERQVDEVARRTGIDPLEMRRRNLLKYGEEVRPGGKPLDADLIGDVERAAAAIGWGGQKRRFQGRGLAVGLLAAGAQPVSIANVRLEASGEVSVFVGTTEVGQGARTVMAQIAAEVLALPVGQVTVRETDTQFTPYDRSTGASRSTTLAGKAVQHAAEDLRGKLVDAAAELWAVDTDAIELSEGTVSCGALSSTYQDLLASRFGLVGGELVGHGDVHPTGAGTYAEGPVFWEVCVAGAEVDVDPETGFVRVSRLGTVADVGKAINPQLVERQDEGGAMQGLGNALFEEMAYGEDAVLLNDTLLDYRVPRSDDVPEQMSCALVENADGPGPFGAKGCGEGALAAASAAIAGALADAGAAVHQLPATPERVWQTIRSTSEVDEPLQRTERS